MLKWLRRPPSDEGENLRWRALNDALTRLERADQARAEALAALRAESGETAEGLKKLARSFGRTALRVEEIERKLAAPASGSPEVAPRSYDGLFDAQDLLDRAMASLDADDPIQAELARGLDGVQARITDHLVAEGFERVAPHGQVPDGTLVRVVDTVASAPDDDGKVVSVVRAAVRHHQRLVREGEVIIAKHQPGKDLP